MRAHHRVVLAIALAAIIAIGSGLIAGTRGADCIPSPEGIGTIHCVDFGTRNASCPNPDSCWIQMKFKNKGQKPDGSTYEITHTTKIELQDGETPVEKAEQFYGGIPSNVATKCRIGTTVCFQLLEDNLFSEIDILQTTISEVKTGEDATVHALCEKPPHYQFRTPVIQVIGTGADPQGEAGLGMGAPEPFAVVPTFGLSGPQVAQQLAAAFNALYQGSPMATPNGNRVFISPVACERGIYGGASDPSFEWSIGMMAGDVLFYSGHGGFNGGHAQLAALYGALGAVFVESEEVVLPDLTPFKLAFISLPGIRNPSAFFTGDEKLRIHQWLQDGWHRLVLIGESGPVYGQGIVVLQDLCGAIGTGFFLQPQEYDNGCFSHQCASINTNDPLVQGLNGLCKSGTATWNGGTPVSCPAEAPNLPWIVTRGSAAPCICGIGDAATLDDTCGHLNDPNTAEFARRLYQQTCANGPASVPSSSTSDLGGALRVEPNPSRDATRVTYRSREHEEAILEVYGAGGQVLRTIRSGLAEPGAHEMVWDGRDAAGRPVPSGCYLLSLRLGQTRLTGRSTLIR